MAWVIAIRDGFARLVEIAPTGFWVLSEDNDWALVGDDFRSAIESAQDQHPELDLIDDENGNPLEATS